MTLDAYLEGLYDLDRHELRKLAAEALLISDGPDMPAEYVAQDGGDEVGVLIEGLSMTKANTLGSVTFNVVINFPR